MAIVAQIKFVQGMTIGVAGRALAGTAGSNVVASNGDDSDVVRWKWTMISAPGGSVVPEGVISDGPTTTMTFLPDVAGGYHVELQAFDVDGNSSIDRRVFQVPEASGDYIPPFQAEAPAMNFGGQLKGWHPYLEALLRKVGSGFRTANGDVVQAAAEIASLATGNTATIGSTFSLAANRTYIVDVEVVVQTDGPSKSRVFNERRVFRTAGGVVSANAQAPTTGPEDNPPGAGPASSVAIAFTGTTGRIDVTNTSGSTVRASCVRQIRYLETAASAPFDPLSVGGGPTIWYDAADVTAGGGLLTAINNKGSTGLDPTISAAQPSYVATNAAFNNRPTWKCDAGLGAARYIQATPAQHGLTTGPYTFVIVGRCKNANYALGTPSGNTAIGGGGGTGDKWQATSDAFGNILLSLGLADVPTVLIVVLDGAASRIYANGKTPVALPAGTLENLAASNLFIGNYGVPTDALGADGDTTHVLGYPVALADADCEYLADGFGAESGIAIAP